MTLHCPHCSSVVPESARFCPACGGTQSSASQMPTAAAPVTPGWPPGSSATIGRLDSSATSGTAAFAPGQMLAGRYRIIGLIGRGGMGEVYRADDLKLGQAISLKFLPAGLASRPGFLEQFHAEVRNARQVSHPNVCRVYDIGELDGQHFITMEYVDGEDLATLLRRIGRLPPGKADEVGRQLCAGLAAAHEKGVLHRDLKPSNVMLDGHGRVRITDFGLAVRAVEAVPGELAGTPAYMAPEQFEGKPVTVQSDLYSLGLILYEVYTGRRAFDAASFAEWRSRHTTSAPASPTTVERDIEEAAERVIMRCLEKDPSRRPSSALQIAAALPGGDPLAAALAAGETPSPEMVAAAGGEGALAAPKAWALLGTLAALMALVLAIAPYSTDLGLARLTKSAAVLREQARQIVARLGYDANPVDSEIWFTRNYEPMKYLADRKPSRVWRREMRQWGVPVLLNYRQSPRPLVHQGPQSRVDFNDPPLDVSGMTLVSLDGAERLTQFQAIPPQRDTTATLPGPPSWGTLFAFAGLDSSAFVPVTPQWVPPMAYDTRSEWSGPAPWARDVPLRVSAAAWHGKPVYFEVRGPWSRAWKMQNKPRPRGLLVGDVVSGTMLLVLLVAGIYFARRNLRLGRGDRRGAMRLVAFVWISGFVSWAVGTHHVLVLAEELWRLTVAIGTSLAAAMFFAVVYLALEPLVRRRAPDLLIGWARVLEGRFTDARVGRDVLVGAGFGAVIALTIHLANGLPTWFSLGGQTTIPLDNDALQGGRLLVAFLFGSPLSALGQAISLVGVFFLGLVLLRRPAAASILLALIATSLRLGGENFAVELPGAIIAGSLVALVTTRYGLLAMTAAAFFVQMLLVPPLVLDFSAAYAAQTVVVLLVLAMIVIAAFRISLGPRPVFGVALDE